jgi:hypothetical protein
MVIQVRDYGAFRHQPSTAWFVTYILRAPKHQMDRHRKVIGKIASKAREYKCEEQEVRRHEKQKYKRAESQGLFRSSREKSRV